MLLGLLQCPLSALGYPDCKSMKPRDAPKAALCVKTTMHRFDSMFKPPSYTCLRKLCCNFNLARDWRNNRWNRLQIQREMPHIRNSKNSIQFNEWARSGEIPWIARIWLLTVVVLLGSPVQVDQQVSWRGYFGNFNLSNHGPAGPIYSAGLGLSWMRFDDSSCPTSLPCGGYSGRCCNNSPLAHTHERSVASRSAPRTRGNCQRKVV